MKASFRMVQAYTSGTPGKPGSKIGSHGAAPSSPRSRPMVAPGPPPSDLQVRRCSLSSCADSDEDTEGRLRRIKQGSFLKDLEEEAEEEQDSQNHGQSLHERALYKVFGITEGNARRGIPRSRCIHPSSFFFRGVPAMFNIVIAEGFAGDLAPGWSRQP